MQTAIFTLIGVIVGALLSFALDTYRERRGERAELRTAARLVSKDMGTVLVLLGVSIKNKRGLPGGSALTDQWKGYEDVLAARLDDKEDWKQVSGGLNSLALLSTGYKYAETLTDADVKVLKGMQSSLKKCRKILAARLERESLRAQLRGVFK